MKYPSQPDRVQKSLFDTRSPIGYRVERRHTNKLDVWVSVHSYWDDVARKGKHIAGLYKSRRRAEKAAEKIRRCGWYKDVRVRTVFEPDALLSYTLGIDPPCVCNQDPCVCFVPPPPCGHCGGTGSVDSGGNQPWGQPIMIPCPACYPSSSLIGPPCTCGKDPCVCFLSPGFSLPL